MAVGGWTHLHLVIHSITILLEILSGESASDSAGKRQPLYVYIQSQMVVSLHLPRRISTMLTDKRFFGTHTLILRSTELL